MFCRLILISSENTSTNFYDPCFQFKNIEIIFSRINVKFSFIGKPFLLKRFTKIVWILHLFPTIISVKILSPIIAIFFESSFISEITSKVIFFLGFSAFDLYLISNSLAIFLMRSLEGLLLIKYKENNFLDSLIQFFTLVGIMFVWRLYNVPSTSINKLLIPSFCSFEWDISYIGSLESQWTFTRELIILQTTLF